MPRSHRLNTRRVRTRAPIPGAAPLPEPYARMPHPHARFLPANTPAAHRSLPRGTPLPTQPNSHDGPEITSAPRTRKFVKPWPKTMRRLSLPAPSGSEDTTAPDTDKESR
ncbi:hypothetical protein GCM10010278_35160 [Streptomyces melanogenes]|nr:hypothetical protein GCM10010278_35160 [Streptomyces melanogenes]